MLPIYFIVINITTYCVVFYVVLHVYEYKCIVPLVFIFTLSSRISCKTKNHKKRIVGCRANLSLDQNLSIPLKLVINCNINCYSHGVGRVQLVDQELSSFPEYVSSTPEFKGFTLMNL